MNSHVFLRCVVLDLDGSPEYEKMISEAEQHRLSRGSADGSVGSPHDPQALDSDDFVNKVCKFEMISRGKSATSPTAKSPPATSSGSGVKYGGYTSSTYMGEKVFSRDIATTRVPAAVLGGSGERVISTCSSLSSSSLTSVSTLNCSSDSSGSNRSLASPPITPQGSIVGGYSSHTPTSPTYPLQGPATQGPVFVTLGKRRPEGRGEPSQVTIRPSAEVTSPTSRSGMVNGDTLPSKHSSSTASRAHREGSTSSSGARSHREGSTSSKDDSSDTSSHRNTFEGIDFDVTQMTESEQELARRHREIVAERKREQEQEKMERQRLEEILRMCAEYQQEVDVKPGTKAQGKAHATSYTSTATSSTAPAKTKRGAPPPAFLDLAPGSDQVDHNQKAGANVSGGSAKSLEVTAGDGERKISGDFRANVTKIKTNGSLMLSSPSNPHKEGLFGFQMRRAESNSSTSEDEMLGSSEDTGTIKRRPINHPPLPEEFMPSAAGSSSAHIALDVHVPSQPKQTSSYVTTTQSPGGSSSARSNSSGVQHSSASTARNYSAGDVSSKSTKETAFSSGQSRIDEILNSSFEAEREAAELSSYGKFSVHINAQISCDDTSPDGGDDAASVRRASYKRSNSSTSSSKGSRSSVSSSHTVQDQNSPDGTDTKEDTPTPVNSDTEPAEGDGDAFRRASTEGQHLSNGVEAHHGADSLHLRMKEQSELSHQLEVLKKTKTQLLQKIAALKRQITDIETQENEAIRELEMERALLEGEHKTEMEHLHADQEKVNELKQQQHNLLERAARQREKAEARFEEEKERISQKLMQDQQQLLVKYKAREDRLQHIDTQQRDMLHNVKTNLEGLERERLQLIDTFKKEKQAAAEVQQKIVELSRMLSLPTVDPSDDPAALNSDIELEEQADGPRKLFIDSTVLTRTETDAASDTSGGGGSSSGAGVEGGSDNGGKDERKKSTTLLEIERNRSIFMEQQGVFIMDQERRRIEELRRRAADEGRALWEERRLREANCKSFNSLESEDSSISSSCDTPSEKETSAGHK
ncbi:hypothetical protein BaRGS_00017726, partial [Batillaria attramentaria]